jgi:hypothetical protein
MKTMDVMMRSLRDVMIWLLVYVIVLVVSGSTLLLNPSSSEAVNVLIGISPVVPVAFILRAVVQVLQHSDELQQKIQLLSIGFSAAATALGTFAYGQLELRIGPPAYPPIPSFLILPIMVLLWAVGMLYFKWRYR